LGQKFDFAVSVTGKKQKIQNGRNQEEDASDEA
jgi:hypothetical protein